MASEIWSATLSGCPSETDSEVKRSEDFRQNHPGGSLGQRLKVRVTEVMLSGGEMPVIEPQASAAEAVRVLNQKNKGVVLVTDREGRVLGIVTDGDIRRAVVSGRGLAGLSTAELMTANPICILPDRLAADALSIMQRHEITALPIIDAGNRLLGLLHLHNLLGKGEFRFLV
jgi:arabinose-5-phosphate isomerase